MSYSDFNAANVSEAEQSFRDDVAIALHPELALRLRTAPPTTLDCICGHNVGTHAGYAPCPECPCAYGIGEAALVYGTVLPSDLAQWARAFAARAGA